MKLLPKEPVKPLIVFAYIFSILILVLYVLPQTVKLFLPAILALVISMLIEPWVGFLEKKAHIPRKVGSIIAILLVITLVGLIMFNLVYQAVYFLQSFALKIPSLITGEHELPGWLASLQDYLIKLPDPMQSFVDDIKGNLISNISQLISPATRATFSAAADIAARLPRILIFAVVLILSTYFISYDRGRISEFMMKIMTKERFEKISRIKKKLFEACGAYFRAQLILMCIIFCVLLVGFLILRVDNAPVIALAVAFVDAIPILGTGTVLIPWAIVSLIEAKYALALGLVIVYVCALVVRQFTEPKVVSTQIGLHPLITITAMYVGLRAVGIAGMIFGPIIAILIIKIVEIENEFEQKKNGSDIQ